MTQQEKKEYWQQHITSQRESRLTLKAYCEQNKLKKATFGYWKKRLTTPEVKKSQRLIPVSVEPNGVITITIQGCVRLEVPEHTLARVLPDILQAVNGEVER